MKLLEILVKDEKSNDKKLNIYKKNHLINDYNRKEIYLIL